MCCGVERIMVSCVIFAIQTLPGMDRPVLRIVVQGIFQPIYLGREIFGVPSLLGISTLYSGIVFLHCSQALTLLPTSTCVGHVSHLHHPGRYDVDLITYIVKTTKQTQPRVCPIPPPEILCNSEQWRMSSIVRIRSRPISVKLREVCISAQVVMACRIIATNSHQG